MITIVDYGMGNLGSIANMLKKVGAPAVITGEPEAIARAEKLILPGVGAFDNGMKNLEARGLLPVLHRKAKEEQVPILGICLGMQLLTRSSEEGTLPGLGWVEADTRRFRFEGAEAGLKIPHMGWNFVTPTGDSPLVVSLPTPSKFYFVHSYHVVLDRQEDRLLAARYGFDFTAALASGNVMGVQFHPEKSHRYGMTLLSSFAAL